MHLKQREISLVKTLAGLGLAAIFCVILIKRQQILTKRQTKNKTNQAIAAVTNSIHKVLANRASCSHTLSGKGVGDSIPQIIKSELATNVKIASMKIIEINNGKDKKADNLQLIFHTSLHPVVKNFRILGNKDRAGKFLNCFSENTHIVENP